MKPGGDLPSVELVDTEITRWNVMFQLVPPEDRRDNLAKAMKECDQQRFPNLHVLLRIACTLPDIL